MELVGGGSVINGPYPVSLFKNFAIYQVLQIQISLVSIFKNVFENKANTISAKLLELNFKVQMFNPTSVLVTFQVGWHFSFKDLSVLVTFQFC